jgi:pimeloyl-ACP methyl ester carboxylesterase
MRRQFKTTDGITLSYAIDDFSDPWRKTETLLMLHSAMGSANRFYAMVPALARHYRVVRLDLRGHGESEVPPATSALTMDRLVEDVHELISELGVDAVHLLGNSAGGFVGQHLTFKYPELVKSLMLFGSSTGLKGTNATSWLPRVAREGLRPFIEDTIAYRFNLETTDPGLVEWFLDEIEKNDTEFVGRFITLMTQVDSTDRLSSIRCPTLLVIPGAEAESGIRNYEPMKTLIPRVEVRYSKGAAHNMMDSDPAKCAEEVLRFLSKSLFMHLDASKNLPESASF